MRFRVHSAKTKEDGELHIVLFGQSVRQERITMQLSIPRVWEHKPPAPARDLRIADAFRGASVIDATIRNVNLSTAPRVIEGWTDVYLLSIPHEIGRILFFQIVTVWAQVTMCPLEVRKQSHPGYELTAVVFNKKIIAADKVTLLIQTVFDSFAKAELIVDHVVTDEEQLVEEEEVDFNAEEAIDHELDSELSQIIKGMGTEEIEEISTLHAAERQEYDVFAAHSEIAAGKLSAPIEIPLKQKEVYAANSEWSTLGRIYAQSGGRRLAELFARLPLEWFREHQATPAKQCFLTPAAAYRGMLPASFQNLTDDEIEAKYPDLSSSVHTLMLDREICIIEDAICGIILIGNAQQRYINR